MSEATTAPSQAPAVSASQPAEPGRISRAWAWAKGNWKSLLVAVVIIVLIILVVYYGGGYNKGSKVGEGFSGPFNLWGTPDWKIRNKGHRHQKRSDSHVMKSNARKSGKKWGLDAMKKRVDDINRRANR